MGAVVALDPAVLDGERAVRVAHVDAAAVALGTIVRNLDVVELQRALAAVHGDARAVPVAPVVLVGKVTRDGGVGDERARGVARERDAAGAVPVVAGTAGDQAAVHGGLFPAAFGVFPEVVVVGPGVHMGVGVSARAAVEVQRTAVDVDDLTRALRIPLVVAVAQGLAAVDHVAVQVDVVGVAVGDLDATVAFGVPIGEEVDGELLLMRGDVPKRGHVLHGGHNILGRVAVVGVVVLLAGDLAHRVLHGGGAVRVGALRRRGREGKRYRHRGDHDSKHA